MPSLTRALFGREWWHFSEYLTLALFKLISTLVLKNQRPVFVAGYTYVEGKEKEGKRYIAI